MNAPILQTEAEQVCDPDSRREELKHFDYGGFSGCRKKSPASIPHTSAHVPTSPRSPTPLGLYPNPAEFETTSVTPSKTT